MYQSLLLRQTSLEPNVILCRGKEILQLTPISKTAVFLKTEFNIPNLILLAYPICVVSIVLFINYNLLSRFAMNTMLQDSAGDTK